MEKKVWKSKTLLGFGIAALVALGQLFGVGYSETTTAELVKLLGALLGVYGLRDALG